jgi:sigma-E factor negative regulatory protein RseC
MVDGLLADSVRYKDLWVAGSAVLSFLLSLYLINQAQYLLLLSHYARPVVVRKI